MSHETPSNPNAPAQPGHGHAKIQHCIGTPLKARHSTPIHSPGKRLMHHVPLRFIQRRVSGGGHKAVSADLNLTSMIDYLVITVVFLLSNFGTAQELASQQGLEIPAAPRAEAIKSAPIISISSRVILLAGDRVATPDEVRTSSGDLPRLLERLQDQRRNFSITRPTEVFEGDIVFQIDRATEWEMVKRIAMTCAHAGYVHLNFAVNKGSDEGH